MKLLSIIIVTKNCLDRISGTIDSIVTHPDYESFELVVIDGASTDGTPEYVVSRSPDSVVCSEPDFGIYDAMNKGLFLATGKWCYFINAGDVLVAQYPLKSVLHSHSDSEIIISDLFIDTGHYRSNHVVLLPLFLAVTTVCHQSIVMTRSLASALLFNTGYRFVADQDQLFRALARTKKVAKINRALCYWQSQGFCSANINELADELSNWRLRTFRHVYPFLRVVHSVLKSACIALRRT